MVDEILVGVMCARSRSMLQNAEAVLSAWPPTTQSLREFSSRNTKFSLRNTKFSLRNTQMDVRPALTSGPHLVWDSNSARIRLCHRGV